ncbi:MAG TPA: hypothetical protein VGR82_08240 [Methylomirabilota bacterium]|jgi:hypothetical protein|nr:hypothetical protein [Methylomirabilota bacterium]
MKRPAKKTNSSKKAAKKPAARPAASGKRGGKAGTAKAKPRPGGGPGDRQRAEPYTPKPIEGLGWPAFRYPLQ